jgi:ribosome-binding factor A
MNDFRQQRLEESLREELAELIEYEMADPRAAGVKLTDVRVSADRKIARVLIRAAGAKKEQKEALEALQKAAGFLRSELATRLNVFQAPRLQFERDVVASSNTQVKKLLRKARGFRGNLPKEMRADTTAKKGKSSG